MRLLGMIITRLSKSTSCQPRLPISRRRCPVRINSFTIPPDGYPSASAEFHTARTFVVCQNAFPRFALADQIVWKDSRARRYLDTKVARADRPTKEAAQCGEAVVCHAGRTTADDSRIATFPSSSVMSAIGFAPQRLTKLFWIMRGFCVFRTALPTVQRIGSDVSRSRLPDAVRSLPAVLLLRCQLLLRVYPLA